MEITLEAIISFIGLFVGGGGGAFFMWRYQKRKAKAEAVTAEVEAAKDMQELYKKMIDHSNEYLDEADKKFDAMRDERDSYKADNDELRQKIDKLTKMFYELKTESEKERAELRVEITSVKSQMHWMESNTCIVEDCKLRQIIVFADKKKKSTKQQDTKEQ